MLVGALCALLFLVAGGLGYAGRGRSIILKGFPTPRDAGATTQEHPLRGLRTSSTGEG